MWYRNSHCNLPNLQVASLVYTSIGSSCRWLGESPTLWSRHRLSSPSLMWWIYRKIPRWIQRRHHLQWWKMNNLMSHLNALWNPSLTLWPAWKPECAKWKPSSLSSPLFASCKHLFCAASCPEWTRQGRATELSLTFSNQLSPRPSTVHWCPGSLRFVDQPMQLRWSPPSLSK